MADVSVHSINVDFLREEIREPVRTFAQRLIETVGDNLESFSVVGSALTSDFDRNRSDINTVLVVHRRSHKLLKSLADMGQSMERKRLQVPILVTREYIERSLDVFGVEFLDFQLNHQMILGPDPFTDLVFHKECVRLQCERELKSALIQLRQGYVQSLGKHRHIEPMLVDCVKKLIVLMRTMLWLNDVDRPKEFKPALDQAAEKFQIPTEGRDAIMILREKGGLPAVELMDPMFEHVYQVIDHLSRVVDQMKV
jgi:hypothetical protein